MLVDRSFATTWCSAFNIDRNGVSKDAGTCFNIARIAAKPGEILVGDSTYQEIQGQIPTEALPPQPLKGKREPVKVYRVLQSVITGEEPAAPAPPPPA